MNDELAAWLCGEEAQSVFKAGWLRADREGRLGERVAAGLEAVVERAKELG